MQPTVNDSGIFPPPTPKMGLGETPTVPGIYAPGLLPGGCRNDVFRLPGLEVVVRLNNLRPSVSHAVNARLLSAGRNEGLPVANHGHCASWNAFQFVERSTIDDVKLVCAALRIVAQILGDLIQA